MKFNSGVSSFVYLSSIAVVFQKILLQYEEDIGWMDWWTFGWSLQIYEQISDVLF